MAGRRTYDIPLGRLFSVAPGIPTTDMARTIGHYQRLGFTFSAPGPDVPPPLGSLTWQRHEGQDLTFVRLVRICFRLLDAGGRLQGWLPCPARGARALAIRWHRTGSTVNPFSSPQSQ